MTEGSKSYIDRDGDALELDDAWVSSAKRGRPTMPESARKKRVNLMLDPDVVDGLKAHGNMSAEANSILRRALGL